jgi:hypothetical protein
MRLLSGLALVVLATAPVAAQSISLDQLGFGVNPPAGYAVEQMTPNPGFDLQYGVRHTTGGGPKLAPGDVYTCMVGFMYQPAYAQHSQQAINDNLIGAREITRVRMGETFDLKGFDTFRQGDVEGIEVLGVPRAEQFNGVALVMVSIMENPVGRAVVSCPGVVDEIETAPVVFRAIRATVTLPRLP